jgi:hypothetical protein
MNTPRLPAVHDRGALTHERIQHLLPPQASAHGHRPILHLNPKKGSSMQANGDGAVAESGTETAPSRVP